MDRNISGVQKLNDQQNINLLKRRQWTNLTNTDITDEILMANYISSSY